MIVHFKLSMTASKEVMSGRILNTSMKNNKYKNLLWIEPTKQNGERLPQNKRSTVCISTRNLVPKTI